MRYHTSMIAPAVQITPAPQPPLILVIDIGSSSTRALLYDATATMVAGSMVREKSAFHTAADGTAEDDAIAVSGRVTRCIDAALEAAGPLARSIAAVACDSYVSNIFGLDAAGTPCTPVFTYADTRPTAAAALLRTKFDERVIQERTGCLLRTSYVPALLTWLADEQPRVFRAARRWSSLGEWLFGHWFESTAITFSAAAWTGLLNRAELAWDAELLRALRLDVEQLGTLADVDQPFIGLREPWRSRWPALANVPWYGAIGDGAAANIGCGATNSERVALSVGTTGALRVVLGQEPEVPPGLWCYRVDRRSPLLGSATSEGGNVLDWALRTLKIDTDALDHYLLDPQGASHGLTVLPFIAGERGPGWRGDIDATINGITLTTTALDVARAALEGVTYRWALIAALLRPALIGTPLVIASGGGLKYVPRWAQVIADASGLPVALSTEAETTSRGVALLALRSLGHIADLHQLPAPIGPIHQPDPDRFAQHQPMVERQARLYEQMGAWAERSATS